MSSTLLLGACTSEKYAYDSQDPLQPINRATYAFNKEFDKIILKPTATVYKKVTPAPVRTGVTNFFSNMGEVPTMINDGLQFNPVMAYTSLWRLIINSSVGVLGIFDVASHMGLQKHYNDFGITLAKWGITESPYIVIPFVGPSNIRDGLALLPNLYYFSLWPYIEPPELAWGLFTLDVVNLRASLLNSEEVMDRAAMDEYVFIRNAYMQRRDSLINKRIGYRVEGDDGDDPFTTDDEDPLEEDPDAALEADGPSVPPASKAHDNVDPLAADPQAATDARKEAYVDDPINSAKNSTKNSAE